jgi:hypothetical protein
MPVVARAVGWAEAKSAGEAHQQPLACRSASDCPARRDYGDCYGRITVRCGSTGNAGSPRACRACEGARSSQNWAAALPSGGPFSRFVGRVKPPCAMSPPGNRAYGSTGGEVGTSRRAGRSGGAASCLSLGGRTTGQLPPPGTPGGVFCAVSGVGPSEPGPLRVTRQAGK